MPVVNYVWDVVSDNVLMETDDEGGTIARYVQEPGLYGEAISQERDGQVRYYNYDGLGDTSELTDDNQDVTDTYEYTAFGEEVARTGTTENPFRYKGALGYYTDSETDDVYVRARTYQPTIARWLSIDALPFADGPHLYWYVCNDPVAKGDPSGHYEITIRDGPDFFSPGYNIDVYIRPPAQSQLPPDSTQTWQVNHSITFYLTSKCKFDGSIGYVIDFFDTLQLKRKRQYDRNRSRPILREEFCLYFSNFSKTLGMNAQGEEYRTPSDITVTEEEAKVWLEKLRAPKETWYIRYFYLNRANCKCCPLLHSLIDALGIPDGEYLYIPKVDPGEWQNQ